LQLALQNAPTPVRKFHLGMTYLKTGEDRLGKEMVRAALLQDPNLVKTERGW
jgi:Tfp pilus assembly protein PilF